MITNKAVAATQPTNAAPIINVSIGKELVDLLRPVPAQPLPPALPAIPAQPVAPAPAPSNNTYDLDCQTILQANSKPGPDMPMPQFCEQFELCAEAQEKFHANRYYHARMLRFLTVQDLTTMDFLLGEIAMVRDAVERWSTVE